MKVFSTTSKTSLARQGELCVFECLPRVFRQILSLVFMTTISCILPTLANGLILPTLPDSEHADTEASSNATMMGWKERTRAFNVTLQSGSTPSNNVQVAFGTDESTDGNLSDEESDLTLGGICGAGFISSDAFTNRFTVAPASSGVHKELSFQMSFGEDGLPRTLDICDGNASLAFSGLYPLPASSVRMYSKHGNLLKVIAGGTDEQNGQVTIRLAKPSLIMLSLS